MQDGVLVSETVVTEGFSHRGEDTGLIGGEESTNADEGTPTAGWVTLVNKDGTKLVSSRLRLDSRTRQQYNDQWSRRLTYDKALEAVAKKKAPLSPKGKADKQYATSVGDELSRSLVEELQSAQRASDKAAFAFGGVYPGKLHAHGRLPERHRVFYSVGVAGRYLLHVRLRQQAASLKGSPFTLIVHPGKASALSTTLPKRIFGEVGGKCSLTITTGDQMGNVCMEGGAKVECPSELDAPEDGKKSKVRDFLKADCVDNGDGSYCITWNSSKAGQFDVAVKIGGLHVRNSPTQLNLVSTQPKVEKCKVFGDIPHQVF